MIGVQAIDSIATITVVATGAITLSQATTAASMPVLLVALAGAFRAERCGDDASRPARPRSLGSGDPCLGIG